jgi:hypothetical protein
MCLHSLPDNFLLIPLREKQPSTSDDISLLAWAADDDVDDGGNYDDDDDGGQKPTDHQPRYSGQVIYSCQPS